MHDWMKWLWVLMACQVVPPQLTVMLTPRNDDMTKSSQADRLRRFEGAISKNVHHVRLRVCFMFSFHIIPISLCKPFSRAENEVEL